MSSLVRHFGALLGITCVSCFAFFTEAQQSKRPITVADCVQTRRIFEGQVELSPDGESVAYVVEAPDVATNKNHYRLYLRDLKHPEVRDNGKLLLDTERVLRGVNWPAHSNKLFLMEELEHGPVVIEVDTETADTRVAVTSTDAIASFSVDASGDMIVFSAWSGPSNDQNVRPYLEYGYAVVFGKGLKPPVESNAPHDLRFSVFLAKRAKGGRFEVSKINSPLTELRGVTALTLSPSGRFLILSYKQKDFPKSWQRNPYVRWCLRAGIIPESLGLYDFESGKFQLAFDSPSAGWAHPAVWADDSQAFSVNALSPADSAWEKTELRAAPRSGDVNWPYTHTHTFAVDLRTMRVTEVAKNPAIWFMNQIVSWKTADAAVLLRKDDHTFTWLKPGESEWEATGDSRLSVGNVNIYSAMYIKVARLNAASDGKRIVGAFETRENAPEIFVHDLSTGRTSVLTDLNPELRGVVLVPVEAVAWRDRHGFHCTGSLIKPWGYEPGKRYPLVIMTKTWWDHYFLADTEYHTAFPPQPLASSGFLVLLAEERPRELEESRSGKYPGHYPGHMGEAAELKDIIDGAIDLLVRKGLADKRNVGIMGFSTTSWKTDVVLTRYGSRFRAASSADSGLWNYGLYWSSNDAGMMRSSEEYLGGPPYGKTSKHWRTFSPAFNAFRVETPLLMEYTARGRTAIDGLEFFVALTRQGRPADLFYYPRGDHVLDTPSERMASLQRNVDWFRFWMQGYEGRSPTYDPEQYTRWNALKHNSCIRSKTSVFN